MRKAILLLSYLAIACNGKESAAQSGSQEIIEDDELMAFDTKLLASKPASAFQAPRAAGTLPKTSRDSMPEIVAKKAAPAKKRSNTEMASANGLEELSNQLNPVVGYWDPLKLGTRNFWDQGNEATVGFLRHAEIKHGRVAMAAFVGYCLQSNGIVFPWKLTEEISFSDIAAAGSPPAQWDALPTSAKLQILIFIGILEFYSESTDALEADGGAHYMRGGVPGKFPNFKEGFSIPHPVPFNLYDPFQINAKKSREELDKSLLAELNNGRLAQIGIFGLISASKGLKVPGLDNLGIAPYDGEVMAPFTVNDEGLPFVTGMLKSSPLTDFR